MTNIIESFQSLYSNLNKDNIASVDNLYDQDAVFIDPFHEIHGIDQLKDYFVNMYENVNECNFKFSDSLVNGNSAALFWSMQLRHSKLNNGKPISVPGGSLIRFSQKVNYHRDYFDAGALIYEQIPVLNRVIKKIKERL